MDSTTSPTIAMARLVRTVLQIHNTYTQHMHTTRTHGTYSNEAPPAPRGLPHLDHEVGVAGRWGWRPRR